MKTIKDIINELLTDYNLSKEFLADKFHVRTITIERWASGEFEPPYMAQKYINRVYNGYKKRKRK